MDATEFRAALERDSFTEIAERFLPAAQAAPEHSHAFGARALVLEGGITLTVHGQATTYGAGEAFTMAPGCPHAEAVGPAGVRYISGRQYGAA